jgi:hypothetical protein
VEVLLSVLEGLPGAEPSGRRIVLPTELAVRVSCGSTWQFLVKGGDEKSSDVMKEDVYRPSLSP